MDKYAIQQVSTMGTQVSINLSSEEGAVKLYNMICKIIMKEPEYLNCLAEIERELNGLWAVGRMPLPQPQVEAFQDYQNKVQESLKPFGFAVRDNEKEK
jgi:hypothetical protein